MSAAALGALLGVVARLEVAESELVLVEMGEVVLVAVAEVEHLTHILRHVLVGVVRKSRHELVELNVLLVVLLDLVVNALVSLKSLLSLLDGALHLVRASIEVNGILDLSDLHVLLAELHGVGVGIEQFLVEGLF